MAEEGEKQKQNIKDKREWERNAAETLKKVKYSQLTICLLLVCAQQRNPPGVNPAQYQQQQPQLQRGHPPPPQHQQFQQGQPQQFAPQGQIPQQQFQQVPQQQFQQVPVQQQQFQQQQVPQQQFQQVQQQQPQQAAQHAHQHAPGQQKVLHKDMQHEKE